MRCIILDWLLLLGESRGEHKGGLESHGLGKEGLSNWETKAVDAALCVCGGQAKGKNSALWREMV